MNMGFLLLAFNQISNNMGMLRYTSGGNFTIPTVVRGPGGVAVNWALNTANAWRPTSTRCRASRSWPQHPDQCQGPDEGRHPGQQPGALL